MSAAMDLPASITPKKSCAFRRISPLGVEVVEFTERIEKILPQLDGMIGGGLMTLEKVRVILYRSSK